MKIRGNHILETLKKKYILFSRIATSSKLHVGGIDN